MLAVDLRRMFTTRFLYIMAGICLAMPIFMLVMTTMMDGGNHHTAAETVREGFKNTWQAIGTDSHKTGSMSIELTTMCNINML